MNTIEIINEVVSRPIEDRLFIVDSLLNNINPCNSKIDEKWISLAELRLKSILSGEVNLVEGEEVFKKLKNRFNLI
ncbi:MAG: hypothetical protein A2015_02830 [Spirochaetes bacterium GWF1_31_7]|nr:MAG: hypothetical protein A2Y30_12210 [Spirochaetes bacterium GWE1_32_154]OHD47512.1 MAG: hypothetical protein A2015_02830 [Spirochaetes bacterium GWF1_31_7]OHD81382.1 MAG: hypothetical protein A2355_03560 [Spirochaetes bacterium RIFOXYB1_FULL_32_8]